MPASVCDSVSSALRLSLSADDSQNSNLLESRLYSSAKSVLLSKIEFEETGDYQSNVLDGLKSKYVVIRQKKPVLDGKVLKKDGSSGASSSDTKNGEDGLPRPKRVLFSLDSVQLGWHGSWSAGAGMQNVGNTCYLNSTLQALFHVPALANWLITELSHSDKCNQQEACVICGMRATLVATQKSGGNPIKPWQVYSKLRLICRHLTPGRQEDAHEFLRYLVEAMEKCYLTRFPGMDKLDTFSKETTPLNQILGGYLRSTVRCLACHHLSTTYQHFQDLLVDIRKHSTLDEALDSYFSRERLEDLGYKCEACNKKVSATKQFFIERAPMVLCIALKRFSLAGGKLSKHVQFRKKITLTKYMHNKSAQQQPLSYKLVSLVTHLGPSQNCGHYTAIGQAPNGNYYQFDDSCVRPIPLSAVLGTNAYIMFFERDITSDETPSTSTVYGPQLPDNFLNKDKSPLKLTFFRNDERKNSPNKETVKTELIKPVILNSTLTKATDTTNSEPWVVKQNGEVEKVTAITKILNGTDKKPDDDKKFSIVIKRQTDECKTKLIRNDSEKTSQSQKLAEKYASTSKLVKPKSPLEKLGEQMHKDSEHKNSNGFSSKLVPYDYESSGDEKSDRDRSLVQKVDEKGDWDRSQVKKDDGNGDWQDVKPTRCATPRSLVVTTKSMHHAWTVSKESSAPLLSPSLNGVTNKKVKEENPTAPEAPAEDDQSPNTSVSTLSPISADESRDRQCQESQPSTSTACNPPPAAAANVLNSHETLRTLQGMSHRGYSAPVSTWNQTHSHMNREVYEERRDERKRALESVDDMDRGRSKKMKKFHQYNRFNNDRNNYNPFQEKQNKQNWGGNFKYRGDHRPHFNGNKNFNKYKRFNRYNNNNNRNGHHYSRHHH